MTRDPEHRTSKIDTVVVGASAGGVGALRELLGAFDARCPATLFIVLHLAERTPSVLPSVLASATGLVLRVAVDGEPFARGHAFVAPPAKHLTISRRQMHLGDEPPLDHHRPSVDVLFRSAARAGRAHVASVVLSGTGDDGAEGTLAIRAAGGMTLAQDPASAEFAGMPETAIATGAVLFVGRPSALGERLRALLERDFSSDSR